MLNLHPIPEADLPLISSDRRFMYCPNPLDLTDAQLDELIPRERRLEFLRGLACPTQQHLHPTPTAPDVLEKAAVHAT